ncbi:MAG: hypothetical protein A2534_02355 [Candidatus Magasanikbacteria bacterium RIFOXYD2_FULL_39_9]|uniref:Uncharacterized protein n=1 Tax=Candidatus Magasanikbacteria bacterium RIFOXYD1_FULL_40_23 TaxID=1798705 RepID=A0A1F6PB19_9BACT|nr:MAG: hypothetical protein A2534_02355 [Candidatus Magasanikbacteria bacterium RIFOXYD2_FULL_39_9]OGH93367.1 MAG: hypothetical protein A2563_02035 [Candidatus Magasanikbacteria bacterium RIFOXYD1_FULL_40_23]
MPEEADINLSKIDVSRRQLDHALKLFFFNGDPIVIHVLTSNAHEVLHSLGKKTGIKSFIKDDIYEMVKPEKKDHFLKVINAPRNFFKHSNNDGEKTILFSEDKNHHLLWDACQLYIKLTKETTDIIQTYINWFWADNPELLLRKEDIEKYKNFPYNPKNRPEFYQQVMEVLSQKYTL